LAELAGRHDFSFRVVGATRPLGWNLPHFTQIPWALQDELRYFSDFDIGIMPLREFPFVRGKCAFKLIQFMDADIPVVASPVGSNLDVVEDGGNSFFAEGPDDWGRALERLVVGPALCRQMGERGRQIVRERYSLEGRWKPYATIIRECL
jgi:glycosyltransferase involved in cell wall biosynthesis